MMNEEKIGLQQKGHFSHPGQRGRCLSTTRGLSVHVPAVITIGGKQNLQKSLQTPAN